MKYEYDIEADYGNGYEHTHTVETRAEAVQSIKEYRANAPQYPYRIKRVRAEPIPY